LDFKTLKKHSIGPKCALGVEKSMEIKKKKKNQNYLRRILLKPKHFIIYAMCKIKFHD